jgi:hypothetical protein
METVAEVILLPAIRLASLMAFFIDFEARLRILRLLENE